MTGATALGAARISSRGRGYNAPMGRTWIKICGIRDTASARVAAEAGADAVGLVFVERSPRHLTPSQAKAIVAALPDHVEPVGLFVDTPMQQVRHIAAEVGLTTVQLHGKESPGDATGLAPIKVIKALHDASGAGAFFGVSALLFDAPPEGNELPGGSGRTFEWGDLAAIDRTGWPNIIIAGGLTPENVPRAIRVIHPFGVDVSSGVESARGVKDHGQIRAFCAAVRETDDKGNASP